MAGDPDQRPPYKDTQAGLCVAVFVVIATVTEQCILMYAHKGTSIELLVCFQLKLRVKNRCSKRSGSNAIKVCIAL